MTRFTETLLYEIRGNEVFALVQRKSCWWTV